MCCEYICLGMVQQGVQGGRTNSTASLKEWAQLAVGIVSFNDKTLDQGRLNIYMHV